MRTTPLTWLRIVRRLAFGKLVDRLSWSLRLRWRLLLGLRLWLWSLLLLRLLMRRIDNRYLCSIRKSLDDVRQGIRILVAWQVGRCSPLACNPRLELFLLWRLRVSLSFWLAVQRRPWSDLGSRWRI